MNAVSHLQEDVARRIEDAFRLRAELDARGVRVVAKEGKVILYGNVRSWEERAQAEEAARSVPGVSEVENCLVVTP